LHVSRDLDEHYPLMSLLLSYDVWMAHKVTVGRVIKPWCCNLDQGAHPGG